jgi:hypothetical protein
MWEARGTKKIFKGKEESDHLKSADWRARDIAYAGTAPAEVLEDVRAKLKPLLGT